ncbi:MAG: CPBP family intramembrane metalloprotease [Clostridiales bacterium]|nr:CPBP family intramembrane metalloprotease [Clostridiales bacterium]
MDLWYDKKTGKELRTNTAYRRKGAVNVRQLGRGLLVCWRMLYPLLIYEVISSLAATAGLMLLPMFARTADLSATARQDLYLRWQVPLTAFGAIVAAIPLGLLYRNMRWERTIRGKWVFDGDQDFRGEEDFHGNQDCCQNRKAPFYYVVLLGFTACLFGNSLVYLLPLPTDGFAQVSAALYAPLPWEQALCMGVLIPLAEELVFRGLGYGRLREDTGPLAAALISSVYFGLFHANVLQAVYAAILGVLLALLYEWYDSLMAPYMMHMMANLTSVWVTNTLTGALLRTFPLLALLLTVLCGILSIRILLRIREECKHDETVIHSDTLL